MNRELTDEFQTEYEKNYTPELPACLRDYHFLSCLRGEEGREIWLLENASGKQVICKHARGNDISILRTETDIDQYRATNGKFSFFPYVIDYYESETDSYLLREYIEGDTLEELIEKNGPMSPEQAHTAITQLCRCFLRLHHAEPPIIYRDLKPSNVVMTKAGEFFLIDLGSTRSFHKDREQDTMLIGTMATAAPEQYGARQTDGRTDIYALGILYAYLLTGELKKIWEPEQLPKRREAAIILKAISFDPDNRYQNIEEFMAALSPAAGGKKFYLAAIAALTAALACCLLLLLKPASTSQGEPVLKASASPPSSQDESTQDDLSSQAPALSDEVVFESGLMRRAVCAALGKSDGESVRYEELDRITGLFVCGECIFDQYDSHSYGPYVHTVNNDMQYSYQALPQGDISDISLLRYMTNLRELVLDYQQITELTPLDGLSLFRVSLCGNPIRDLAPLESSVYLNELAIDDTLVSSLAPLSSLAILHSLSITRTQVTEIAPVRSCLINYLQIGEVLLSDYDQLQYMPLQGIVCRKLPKSALEPLSQIPTLCALSLSDSNIRSLNELAMLGQISNLDLVGNYLTDFEGIDHFPKLTTLYCNTAK